MAEKKRRARGEGSIRQRKDGTWEARFVVGIDPRTGKDIRKSVYAKTQKEVRKKMTEAVAALDKDDYREPSKMTLAQWLDTWQETYLVKIKPSTKLLYEQQIRLYIRPALGKIKLEDLDTDKIQRFYNHLGKGHDGKPGLSPKSVRNIHGILHKALQQATKVKSCGIRTNPADGCELPRIEQKGIQPLSEGQIPLFLNAVEGHCHEYIYKVALYTGMREGEILGLMWDCVDFSRGTVTIKRQLRREQKKGGEYYLSTPKNGKTRTIVPAPEVMELLRQQKARQNEQKLKAGEAWMDSGFVFTNGIGDRLSYRTVYDCFKRIMAQIGSPSTRFHDLRHTFAVMSLQAGDDIKTVQGNLGHHTAAFTLDVYGHVTDQMKHESASRMQRYIDGIKTENKGA